MSYLIICTVVFAGTLCVLCGAFIVSRLMKKMTSRMIQIVVGVILPQIILAMRSGMI